MFWDKMRNIKILIIFLFKYINNIVSLFNLLNFKHAAQYKNEMQINIACRRVLSIILCKHVLTC